MIDINELLKILEQEGYDELHLPTGSAPYLKGKNGIKIISQERILRPDLETILRNSVPTQVYSDFMLTNILSTSYSVAGLGRYNILAFKQRNTPMVIFKKAYHTLEQDIVINNIDSLKYKPGITILTGKNKDKEVAVQILNKLLEKEVTIITEEETIVYPISHNKGYIYQCERNQDFTDIDNFLEFVKKISPSVLYIENNFDFDSYDRLFQMAINGTMIILNMPYPDYESSISIIDNYLSDHYMTAAKQYINGFITQLTENTYQYTEVN